MSSVKSFYTPGFFPLINRTNFLSRSSRCVLPFSRRVTTDALLQKLFRGCPWVYTQGDWTFWTQDMIWLAYVFYGWHIDFKRHFKTVLSSQRFFARGCGFYFLASFSFNVVVLVFGTFVKFKKRGVCCNSTYLANRKGDYDYLLWRRMAGFENVELKLKQLTVSPQTLCHKRAKFCTTNKI